MALATLTIDLDNYTVARNRWACCDVLRLLRGGDNALRAKKQSKTSTTKLMEDGSGTAKVSSLFDSRRISGPLRPLVVPIFEGTPSSIGDAMPAVNGAERVVLKSTVIGVVTKKAESTKIGFAQKTAGPLSP